jgi:hypothetical protein
LLASWVLAGSVASSGAWQLNEESGGISAVGSGEGESLPGGVGVAPGATEPPPVDPQAEEAWQRAQERSARETREKDEREAAEKAEREAEQRAAAERQATEAAAARRCVVPSLKGESLTAARHALSLAHCALGEVRRARDSRGRLVVVAQSPARGKTLPSEARVDVRLGHPEYRHG